MIDKEVIQELLLEYVFLLLKDERMLELAIAKNPCVGAKLLPAKDATREKIETILSYNFETDGNIE